MIRWLIPTLQFFHGIYKDLVYEFFFSGIRIVGPRWSVPPPTSTTSPTWVLEMASRFRGSWIFPPPWRPQIRWDLTDHGHMICDATVSISQVGHSSTSPSPMAGSQPVQRVKSMFGQSTGKLPPPRLPAHPPPPQRSISHSEVSSMVYSDAQHLLCQLPSVKSDMRAVSQPLLIMDA